MSSFGVPFITKLSFLNWQSSENRVRTECEPPRIPLHEDAAYHFVYFFNWERVDYLPAINSGQIAKLISQTSGGSSLVRSAKLLNLTSSLRNPIFVGWAYKLIGVNNLWKH